MFKTIKIRPFLGLAVGAAIISAGVRAESDLKAAAPAAVSISSAASSVAPDEAAEIERLWQANQKSKAQRALDKWMAKSKDSPWPYVTAASLQYREKKYKKCLSFAETAIKKSPQCAEAYYWRGRSFEAMDKPLEAANEYRAALIAKSNFDQAQEALNRVLVVLGVPSDLHPTDNATNQ